VNLPLAHHYAVQALPVFAPALVVCLVLVVHYLRERRRWDEEEDGDEGPEVELRGTRRPG
jgi:hypothetical protein